jgi:hypothetical protein
MEQNSLLVGRIISLPVSHFFDIVAIEPKEGAPAHEEQAQESE